MSFTSLIFIFFFFPVCVAGYYLTYLIGRKTTGRTVPENIFLIFAGLGFYAWASLDGLLFLLVYMAVVWLLGVLIDRCGRRKTAAVLAGIVLLTAVLVLFKYYNFGIYNINCIFHTEIPSADLAVPLGLSFITFTAVSYLVDIYRGDAKCGNFLQTALYLTFFPKIVSGPIVQWKDFSLQTETRFPTVDDFLYGLNRIMIGFGKKLILADMFGASVNDILWYGEGIDRPTAWICAFFYMMQIYYDFSGYSDIAIGLAALFGFRIRENFCFPYISRSISEFWRRWHISLGTWFREYIYIPLGGNRKGKTRTLLNLFFVFLLTGLWHGAGWNYILWGAVNGICVVTERLLREKKWYQNIPGVLKWMLTMVIVYISWILFRCTSVSEILYTFSKMFGMTEPVSVSFTWKHFLTVKMSVLSVAAFCGAVLPSRPECAVLGQKLDKTIAGVLIKETVLFLVMITAVICMVNSSYSPFLYFQY